MKSFFDGVMSLRSSPRKRGPRSGKNNANRFWIPACAGMNGVWIKADDQPDH